MVFACPLLHAMLVEMDEGVDASWVLIGPYSAPPKQKRELDWFVEELHETLTNFRHGLEDCYALLAPIDPGSTLVLSTPRNEVVKGHITRVGTRIVKGVRRAWLPCACLPRPKELTTPVIPRRQSISGCALSRPRL